MILAMADFHGKCPKLDGLEFDAIIAAGDFCEFSSLRPIVLGATKEGRDWWEDVEDLEELVRPSLESGRKVVEYLLSFGKPVLTIPGNVDFYWEKPRHEVSKKYGEIVKGATDIQGRKETVAGISFVGYGGTWAPEKEMKTNLSGLMEKVESLMPADILVSHTPPANTALDVIGKGPLAGKHYGSKFVRDLIEKHQPTFSICGHIHESLGEEKIGETISINTGPAYDGNAILLDPSNGSYKRIKIGEVLKFY